MHISSSSSSLPLSTNSNRSSPPHLLRRSSITNGEPCSTTSIAPSKPPPSFRFHAPTHRLTGDQNTLAEKPRVESKPTVQWKATPEKLGEAIDAFAQAIQLTPRQIETLRLVAAGYTNPQIGELMGITTRTVKFHVQCLLRKTDTKCRGELLHEMLAHYFRQQDTNSARTQILQPT